MSKYAIRNTLTFEKSYKKLTRKNKLLKRRILRTIEILSVNPYHPGLKTHKADTSQFGIRNSSRVTGDLRLIWDWEDDTITILLFTIQGHEVYK